MSVSKRENANKHLISLDLDFIACTSGKDLKLSDSRIQAWKQPKNHTRAHKTVNRDCRSRPFTTSTRSIDSEIFTPNTRSEYLPHIIGNGPEYDFQNENSRRNPNHDGSYTNNTLKKPIDKDINKNSNNFAKIQRQKAKTNELQHDQHDAKLPSINMQMIADFDKNIPKSGRPRGVLKWHQQDGKGSSSPLARDLPVIASTYNLQTGPKSGPSNKVVSGRDISYKSKIIQSSKTAFPKVISSQKTVAFSPGSSFQDLKDTRVRISLPIGPLETKSLQFRLDSFTANLVPLNPAKDHVSIAQHANWLAKCRNLATTQQTKHDEIPDTARQNYRHDCRKAFASVRLSVPPLKSMVNAVSSTLDTQIDEPNERCRSQFIARENAMLSGTSRFFKYPGFNQAKVRATICYFQNLPSAHLNPSPASFGASRTRFSSVSSTISQTASSIRESILDG